MAYEEGVHVGQRAWGRGGLTPAFPFGHGLGWTRWAYASVTATKPSVSATMPRPAGGDGLQLTVKVTNTGRRTGREVVQVYLQPPQDGPDRPLRLLAGFATVAKRRQGQGPAPRSAFRPGFQLWNTGRGGRRIPDGRYGLGVGRSSRDLCLAVEVTATEGRLHLGG
ncbi:fibronectin type III-like domain-contianing protein [Streptomyces adelaidensis]|uniref:fibronectin type III-like domain-contianing protein n=1 Tax=Streptomyces adelaidensis TaxID=2796465 RepID=UPI001908ADC0|nr:fibronectin type III-like domain-contianing protein [Streptomyces adelaidensis]